MQIDDGQQEICTKNLDLYRVDHNQLGIGTQKISLNGYIELDFKQIN